MHHRNRTPHDETTRLHLASSRSKFKREDQRLAGEQAMRDYKAALASRNARPRDCVNLRLRAVEQNA